MGLPVADVFEAVQPKPRRNAMRARCGSGRQSPRGACGGEYCAGASRWCCFHFLLLALPALTAKLTCRYEAPAE